MAERREAIERELTPALDEAELAQVWRRVRDGQAARRAAPRRRRWQVAAVMASVAAVVAIAVAWPRARVAPGALGGDVALAPGAQLEVPGPIALDDGSRVELAPAAQLEVLANEGDKFVTAVRRGKVRFDVRPGGPRRWVIETDLATVEVVGTAFSVDRAASALAVEVERGVVLVRGERVPGRIVRLTAGQRVEVAAPIAAAEAAAPIAASAPPAPVDPVAVIPPPSVRPPELPAGTAAPSVASVAHRPPSAAVEPISIEPAPPVAIEPPPSVAIEPAPPVDVLARADELVAAGRAAEAADVLTSFLARAPADASAGLAAFSLGRIAHERLRDPGRAATAFARVLAIGSPRALVPEALARRAEALRADGQRPAAQAAAAEYLTRFPDGPRRGAMAALASP